MPSGFLPDLVEDAKIEADFLDSCTRHVIYEAGDPSSRPWRKEERWRRQSILGRGGYGMVHLERCIIGNDNKLRAVKEITKGTITGLESDWISELEAAFKFSHRKYRHCFVRSEAWYELNGRILMAMEFMPLGDLQTNIQDKPLSEFEGRQITEQLLEAVGFMHNSGFIHCDLKPSNIMVVSRAPTWYVRVADFGVSKRSTDSDTSALIPRGTPGYMAPEITEIIHRRTLVYIAREAINPILDQQYSLSTDMWSLGCVVYQILTGTLPFPQISHLSMYCHGTFEFPRDRLLSCKVSDHGQDFVIKLLQARSEDRLMATSAAQHPWMTTSLDPLAPRPRPSFVANSSQTQTTIYSMASTAWTTGSLGAWTTHKTATWTACKTADKVTRRARRPRFASAFLRGPKSVFPASFYDHNPFLPTDSWTGPATMTFSQQSGMGEGAMTLGGARRGKNARGASEAQLVEGEETREKRQKGQNIED